MAPKNRNGHPIQDTLTIVWIARQPTKQASGRQDYALYTSTDLHQDELWN
jgi:hypothetical protein